MIGNHASTRLIAGYAGGADFPGDQVWALEAHLESCEVCRGRLAEVAASEVVSLVEGVWARLEPALAVPPARWRRHRIFTWVTPVMLPWLAMTALVTLIAFGLDLFITPDVSLVKLLAPLLPVLGVAASWSRGLDPAYELVAAMPRAGLYLVLRRTTSVLAVVLPLLLVAGWATGTGLALWLLPSLAFTTGTLALGGLIGVSRAAWVLVAIWAAVVIAPTLALQKETFALLPGALPVWGGIFALTAMVVALRRSAFTKLGAHN
jgi:hypothetical protein